MNYKDHQIGINSSKVCSRRTNQNISRYKLSKLNTLFIIVQCVSHQILLGELKVFWVMYSSLSMYLACKMVWVLYEDQTVLQFKSILIHFYSSSPFSFFLISPIFLSFIYFLCYINWYQSFVKSSRKYKISVITSSKVQSIKIVKFYTII